MPDRRFFNGVAHNTVKLQAGEVRLPLLAYEGSATVASFAVSRRALRLVLPLALRPAPFLPGLAIMSVMTFEIRDSSVGPGAQVAISFPCVVVGGGPITELRTLGFHVWRLITTSLLWEEAGAAVWSFPMLRAEVQQRDEGEMRCCTATAADREILTLQVARGRRFLRDRRVLRAYAAGEGEIQSAPFETSGMVSPHLGPGSARLVLGDHPVADEIPGARAPPAPRARRVPLRRVSGRAAEPRPHVRRRGVIYRTLNVA